MTVSEELQETFSDVKIGTEFTYSQIVQLVQQKFNRNKSSIIPSDYCYNRYNNGICYEKSLHLFEYTETGCYKYLGVNFPYTGKIYHKPKGNIEICVGEMTNGILSSDIDSIKVKDANTDLLSTPKSVHTTKREIGLQLRFKVLKRDNFKCCACGASPAKDPSVELHIDHIIPWSKGGETVIENLQTLCSKCNIGKSNLL